MPAVSRRSFLGGLLAGLTLPAGSSWAVTSDERLLLMITAAGGWDVTYTFDPKPGRAGVEGPEVDPSNGPDDVDAVRTIAGMPLMVNDVKRPAVTRFFEDWGHRTAIVNGIWVGAIGHTSCTVRMLTGTGSGARPDVAVITGHELGGQRPLGSVDFSGFGFSGDLAVSNGRMGSRGQARALVDRSASLPRPDGRAPRSISPELQAAIERRTLARSAALQGQRSGHTSQRRLDDLAEAIDRAQRLRAQGLPLDALGVGAEATPAALGAVITDLFDQGLCRAAMFDSGSQWDTHYATIPQHGYYQALFSDLHGLVDQLAARGLLDRVLVCVVSEMTRTPLRNGLLGKDHWPHTSALFIGGGVEGGRVRGGTDDQLESLPVDLATGELDPSGSLIRYDNLAAGLLDHLGVDAEAWFPGVTPFRGLSV
jgi:hypothetical protein